MGVRRRFELTRLSPKLDVVGTLSYVGVKLDAPGFSSADDSGVGIGARLRGASQRYAGAVWRACRTLT